MFIACDVLSHLLAHAVFSPKVWSRRSRPFCASPALFVTDIRDRGR